MFNIATRYWRVLGGGTSSILLHLIETYVNGAELAAKRFQRTCMSIRRSLMKREDSGATRRDTRLLRLHCDAHFYFICLGQVDRCLAKLCGNLNNHGMRQVHKKLTRTLRTGFRNELEHLGDRASGLARKGRRTCQIPPVRDFVNFHNDCLTFDGKSYPVNAASLKTLREAYRELIGIIHNDYALKDSKFVQDMKRDRRLKKLANLGEIVYQYWLNTRQHS